MPSSARRRARLKNARRIGKPFGRAVVHRREHCVLLLRRQIDERGILCAARERIRRFQTLDERRFFAGEIIAERAIDVNRHVALRRAGAKLVLRNNAIDKCGQNPELRVGKRGGVGALGRLSVPAQPPEPAPR